MDIHVEKVSAPYDLSVWLKIAILWLFFITFWPFWSLFFCYCDHSYAHFRHRLHPKTCHTYWVVMLNLLDHFQAPIWRRGGPKEGYFSGQNRVAMPGWLPEPELTWKLSHIITRQNMYQGNLCPLNAPLWRWSGPKMAIFGSKYSYYGRVVPGRWVPPGNCLMCHITSHYMAKHVSGPFFSSQCTFMTLEWSKI